MDPMIKPGTFTTELLRPWKLFTFAVAMALLLCGAVYYGIADWDVGITLIMGSLTYISAPWCFDTLLTALRRRPPGWPLRLVAALAMAWIVVDGVYVLYHTAMGNRMFREDNFHTSTPIYFMAGAFWLYRGTLRDLWSNLTRVLRRAPPAGTS